MRLTRLEIYGFKSFMRRTQIVFPQNVTGIVGPNGSGKSNISDAVRWVLGEQSARMLRGNSMTDVIFNGTEQRRPLNYCEVTLTFDNTDGQLPVDYAEVSVTRRVYRSGEGEYLMNGSVCRLKDIVDLFRDTGVGREGYSIIGQGRIDEILSQRSEDRRAVFEEAAGISRFRARKEEAETRLRHTEDNLTRVNDLLDEQETHLLPLQSQAEVAKRYLECSSELRGIDVALFLTRHNRLVKREAEYDTQYLRARDDLLTEEKEQKRLTDERVACEERGTQLEEKVSEARQLQLAAIDRQHEAETEEERIKGRMASTRDAMENLTGERESLRQRIRLIEATLSKESGGMEEAEAVLNEARAALEKKNIAFAEADAAASALEEKAEAHTRLLMESMNRMQNAKAMQARQQAVLQQVKQRREEIGQALAQEEASGGEVRQALETAIANREAAEKQLEADKEALAALEAHTAQLLKEMLAAQNEQQTALQNLREAEARLKMLRELQEGYDGFQQPVRGALTYARKMRMHGVRDAFAMLINVPRELETALDMALGASMQNIVTETEEEAKVLIDYLRKNSLGRATFLPMNAIRPYSLTPAERQALNDTGCIGVAAELIDYDDEYENVVLNLLGRTVVVRDLDAGVRVVRASNHAFRVVTLQGDLIHAGGSMTGGSVRQKASNLLGRERETQETAAKVKELTAQAARAADLVKEKEVARGAEKEAREQAEYRVHQQEIAVVRDTERERTARADAEVLDARIAGYRGALEQMDETMRGVSEELAAAERALSTEQASPEELRAESDRLAAQLDTARRAREKAQEARTDAMLTLQNAEHDLDRYQRDQSRMDGEKRAAENELDRMAQKEQTLAATGEELKAALEKCAADRERMAAEATRAAQDVSEREKRRDENRRELHEILDQSDACKARMDARSEDAHQQEMHRDRCRAQIEQLTSRLRDMYDIGPNQAREEYDARDPEAPQLDEKTADARAEEIREEIRGMGTVNVAAIEEYADLNERHTALLNQRDDILQAAGDLKSLIERLLDEMQTTFVDRFSLLKTYFSETFIRLFGGGSGEISLADPDDPLNCGIDIRVQPPGKKLQLLSLFSGGERTLTAIALLFAMLKLKPTPFCILDEIEAALDDANIDNFAEYLKEFSRDTQFVVVTHRKGTMERCDTLFGVAMEEKGVTSLVSINLEDYEEPKNTTGEEEKHE